MFGELKWHTRGKSPLLWGGGGNAMGWAVLESELAQKGCGGSGSWGFRRSRDHTTP